MDESVEGYHVATLHARALEVFWALVMVSRDHP